MSVGREEQPCTQPITADPVTAHPALQPRPGHGEHRWVMLSPWSAGVRVPSLINPPSCVSITL